MYRKESLGLNEVVYMDNQDCIGEPLQHNFQGGHFSKEKQLVWVGVVTGPLWSRQVHVTTELPIPYPLISRIHVLSSVHVTV